MDRTYDQLERSLKSTLSLIAEMKAELPHLDPVERSDKKVLIKHFEDDASELRGQIFDLEAKEHAQRTAHEVATRVEVQRATREEAAFWFRRFFTTLGIANGAAFAALASGLLQADDPKKVAYLAAPAMAHFVWGTILAGSVPLILWMRIIVVMTFDDPLKANKFEHGASRVVEFAGQAVTFGLTGGAVAHFCYGLFDAVGAVQSLIKH
jgi:hypothetical protein